MLHMGHKKPSLPFRPGERSRWEKATPELGRLIAKEVNSYYIGNMALQVLEKENAIPYFNPQTDHITNNIVIGF